ncbi:poly [ADP-ribose] polymerase tankyrase-like isoform X2 [Anneissia japonica]|uniref:poly [ADP-ribose] polymerase tankyrase-like isoform X2 n=1 Tax=Anneissia japonica TaxID=1529436 RepID=UPI001425666F|nr:poly [ADP-ribose] polymerase tankyrase-like isoform X2 [Anneissia japonica]XP_033111342.1 poly [ADP-ribose] polymerase tankyrase-like isoform X2 [Anneissia japonica]
MVQNGETPLMYAVSNAPDDVLENMIETATVENFEQKTHFGGSTILHELVFYARVSAMRRVLEKTNRNINTQDIWGRTPLHVSLRGHWGLTHSYEQHKDMAIRLITFGASATVKDGDRKTPLDLYDDNECEEYEETTRSEKKKELRDLLEELSIPSEILARGPDAVKAFKDALENGEITVVNSRLMFLGNEGSGKTSCVKAMLGKEFNENEPSTNGIVTTTVFQTVGKDYNKWEEQKNVDSKSYSNICL